MMDTGYTVEWQGQDISSSARWCVWSR